MSIFALCIGCIYSVSSKTLHQVLGYVVMYSCRHVQPYLTGDASTPDSVALCNTFHIARLLTFRGTTQT